MKRISLYLLSLALLLLSQHADAQTFNHLSVGLGGGTDGFSMNIATPIGRHIDLLAGYGTSVDVLGFTFKASVPEHPGNSEGNFVDVPLRVHNSVNDGRLLFNIYPSRTGGFHFTLGAYFGSPRCFQATITGLPDDYDQVGIGVDNYLVKASGGRLNVWLEAPGVTGRAFAVKPYAGFGFGRALRQDKRITLTFDIGAQYQGKTGIWAEGKGITGRKRDVQISGESLGEWGGSVDKYLQYLVVWPTINFHVYFRPF